MDLPDWTGQTVVLIASGPSLTDYDVNYVREKHINDECKVVVINDNYVRAPWADMLYACDPEWWAYHKPFFAGIKVTQSKPAAKEYGCLHIPGKQANGISTDPARIHFGSNSGFQALNVAYHCGSRRMLLLGYDMELGPKGEAHWFGQHPDGHQLRKNSPLSLFARRFDRLAAQCGEIGLTVINCSRRTAITLLPRQLITEAL